MVNPQHTHICASSRTTLFYYLSTGIEDLHKRYRAACYTTCRRNTVILRTEIAEGESCAATGLVDNSRIFYCLKYGIERILDGDNKTCGKLSEIFSCIHNGRGVGQEFQSGHHFIEFSGCIFCRLPFPESILRLRNMICDPEKHPGWILNDFSL